MCKASIDHIFILKAETLFEEWDPSFYHELLDMRKASRKHVSIFLKVNGWCEENVDLFNITHWRCGRQVEQTSSFKKGEKNAHMKKTKRIMYLPFKSNRSSVCLDNIKNQKTFMVFRESIKTKDRHTC